MTDLVLGGASMTGLVAWYSLIHVPDDEINAVFAQFQRVLRPGGPLLLSFHVGDEVQLKNQGYGGHPMRAYVHRRRHGQMIAWLSDAGFAVETTRTLTSAESKLGGIILARRQVTGPANRARHGKPLPLAEQLRSEGWPSSGPRKARATKGDAG
jgi:hypothetical protein